MEMLSMNKQLLFDSRGRTPFLADIFRNKMTIDLDPVKATSYTLLIINAGLDLELTRFPNEYGLTSASNYRGEQLMKYAEMVAIGKGWDFKINEQ